MTVVKDQKARVAKKDAPVHQHTPELKVEMDGTQP